MTIQIAPEGRLVRLSWRWIESGISGSSPWTHRADVVEAWRDSLQDRHGHTVQHWIEDAEPFTAGE